MTDIDSSRSGAINTVLALITVSITSVLRSKFVLSVSSIDIAIAVRPLFLSSQCHQNHGVILLS